jgi:hypothetical protein
MKMVNAWAVPWLRQWIFSLQSTGFAVVLPASVAF